MSTCIFEKEMNRTEGERGHLIAALRAALNAAESGMEEVTIEATGMEITWHFEDGEFYLMA